MARINANVSAVVAQRNLSNSYGTLSGVLERLSTGLRINRGKDDPAGLIVSERLRSEIGAVTQAISNTQRAKTIIATTEGALDEVSSLLRDIQAKVIEAANRGALSDDEIKANQLQIDSAIASISRIANSTTFAGRYLLNGSLDYTTSGVQSGTLSRVAVHGAQFGTQAYIPVSVDVLVSAQHARLNFPAGTVTSAVTIELAGPLGTTTVSFGSGSTASAIVSAINAVRDTTGVSASLSGAALYMQSQGFGSRQFVSVKRLPGSGAFDTFDTGGVATQRTIGRDALATINGAQSVGDGNVLTLRTAQLDVELTLADTFVSTTSFSITGGGALFQVGPQVNTNLQTNIGVQSMTASNLGFLSQIITGEDFSLVNGKFTEASRIVSEAVRQVAVMRGRLGAFERNTLETNVNQLSITMENLTSAQSTIRDADFAYETSQLSRAQILVSSGTSVLAIANQTPQTVLRLLGG
jgi:flagellin